LTLDLLSLKEFSSNFLNCHLKNLVVKPECTVNNPWDFTGFFNETREDYCSRLFRSVVLEVTQDGQIATKVIEIHQPVCTGTAAAYLFGEYSSTLGFLFSCNDFHTYPFSDPNSVSRLYFVGIL